ncbi:MAG: glycosyltransferase [Acidobacteria bacterium]|nr:glycosyltransferase [Acidobacteriota bacterium]
MVVNQWLAAAHRGDAIGDSARRVRDLLRAQGHESHVFALTIDEDMREEARPFTDPAARTGEMTILHFALPSPMTAALASLPRGRVLQYHNITPAHFFAPYDPGSFRLAVLARRDLAWLAGRVDLALGDSEYNRQELEGLGFPDTGVFPIAVNVDRIVHARPVPALERWLNDGLTNFLFVGRMAPNKKIEDIVRLAEHYKRYVDAHYRFLFVGRYEGMPRYYNMVRALIADLGWLPDRFLFTGPVPDDELAAYYRSASVYISMSEHEGFGVPLVEAMAADLPVLAYSCTAIPDTLGGAGVQFAPKDFESAAELLASLAFDDRVRADVIAGQRRRLGSFLGDRMDRELRQLVGRFS